MRADHGNITGDESAAALSARFLEAYGAAASRSPLWLSRAPGRINLIGEHTDYNGLPVLPFAIPQNIRMVFQPADDDVITLKHADGAFPDASYPAAENIPPDPAGAWTNYTRAAVQWGSRFLAERDPARRLRGFRALVSGDIPRAGGLSSSSALVVASAQAFLAANGVTVHGEGASENGMDRLALATALAEAETYVGTRGGGMDQAASLFGEAGKALRIDFFPLLITPVPFPDDHAVLACHSLVTADKAGTLRDAYNARVASCRRGTDCLRDIVPDDGLKHLGDFARALGTQTCIETLENKWGADATDAARCRYILREGRRVEEATAALRAQNMGKLGRLMSASHAEARDLFGISCPELDALVDIGVEAGALGARLTGAGFGGFAIMLGRKTDMPRLMDAVDRHFYGKKKPGSSSTPWRFVLNPADGACVSVIE